MNVTECVAPNPSRTSHVLDSSANSLTSHAQGWSVAAVVSACRRHRRRSSPPKDGVVVPFPGSALESAVQVQDRQDRALVSRIRPTRSSTYPVKPFGYCRFRRFSFEIAQNKGADSYNNSGCIRGSPGMVPKDEDPVGAHIDRKFSGAIFHLHQCHCGECMSRLAG